MKTQNSRNPIDRSPLRSGLPRKQQVPRTQAMGIIRGLLFIALFAFACFALSPAPNAFGVVPAPDGGYPGNNTAEGANALFSLTSGIDNNAVGFQALYRNTTGSYNTAEGYHSLFNNTTGNQNTANGAQALFSNTTANYNTALGVNALYRNTTGTENTAVGVQALFNNVGSYNTALGTSALYRNTDGENNTATGWQALFNNNTGDGNTANGYQALFNNVGSYNTALGVNTLYRNTTGVENTAAGVQALYQNTTGFRNTAAGELALASNTTGSYNTANGKSALVSNTVGSFNVALGYNAGLFITTGHNNIDIGNAGGFGAEANTIRIGSGQQATYIAGISGKTATGGAAVFVTANGKLGTVTSSRRLKKDIADMDSASEALLALRPVTFRYKPELDKTGIPQYGLVAEEVAEVNPDLVVRDENGEIYTVRYEAVNAMLLNEFLKEHRKVEEQQATISQLKRGMETVIARLKEQDSKIQKVSAQLELQKAPPQTVLNNQ